jgi:hypothetical protein
MKLKIDEPVRDFKGNIVEVPTPPERNGGKVIKPAGQEVVTFRTIIEGALNQPGERDQVLTAAKKLTAYRIGINLLGGKKRAEYDVSSDQVAFLKERIGMFYSPVVYGRFLELIGDEPVHPEEKE